MPWLSRGFCAGLALLGIPTLVLAQTYAPSGWIISEASNFGSAMAATSRVVAIGARGDNSPGSVTLYDRRNLHRITTTESPTPAMYDGFGVALATLGASFVVGAPGANEIHIVAPDGSNRHTIGVPGDPLPDSHVRFGAAVAVYRGVIFALAMPSLTDVATGRTLATVYAIRGTDGALLWQRDVPAGLQRLVAGSGFVAVATRCTSCPRREGRVSILRATDGDFVREIAPPTDVDPALFGHALAIEHGRLLVSALAVDGGAAAEFHARTGLLRMIYHEDRWGLPPHQSFGNAVAFAGRYVLVSSGGYGTLHMGRVFLYERRSGRLLQRMEGRDDGGGSFGARMLPIGKDLLLGYSDDRHASVEVFSR